MTKRILSLVMVLAMVLSMAPAFAADCNNHSIVSYYKSLNSSNHMVYCTCGIDWQAPHTITYDSFGVATCELCGWEAAKAGCVDGTHDYKWTAVEGGHIEVCTECKLPKDADAEPEAHKFVRIAGTTKWTDPRVCEKCLVEEECAHTETEWKQENANQCFEKCKACGMYVTPVANHDFNNICKPLDQEHTEYNRLHSIDCKKCGSTTYAEHTASVDKDGKLVWVTDTEKCWNVCVCGYIMNEKQHAFQWENAADGEGVVYICAYCDTIAAECENHVATGTNVATCEKYAICDNCGKEMPEKGYAEHVWQPLVNFGATQHGSECTICGIRKDHVEHSYDLIGKESICACGAKTVCEGHVWTIVPAQNVDCDSTVPGHTKYEICYLCNTYKIRPTELKPGHTWIKEVVTPATCLTDGEMKRTCSVCGKIDYVAIESAKTPSAHDLVFVKVGQAATCTGDGYEIWQCQNPACDFYKGKGVGADNYFSVKIEAKGHVTTQIKVDIVDGKVVDELSCEGGIYSYTGCVNCGYMLTEIKPIPNTDFKEHDFVYAGSIAATCNNPAGYLYVCNNNECEVSEIRNADNKPVDMTGYDKYHNVAAGVITHETSATCTEDGFKWFECPSCGEQIAPERRVGGYSNKWVDSDEIITIEAKGHTNVGEPSKTDLNWKFTEATCQEFGYAESKCEVCGLNYRKVVFYEEGLKACKPTNGKAITEEVCDEIAEYQQICEYCGEPIVDKNGKQLTEKAKVEHDYEVVEILVEGKFCGDNDIANVVCTRCGKKELNYTVDNSKEKHDLVYGIIEATCTEAAKEGYFCVICGYETDVDYVEGSKAKDHSWDNGTYTTLCGYDELVIFECSACDAVKYVNAYTDKELTDAEVAALKLKANHKKVDKLYIVKPTCESDGLYITSVCKTCGFVIDGTKVAEKGGHKAGADYKQYIDCTGKYEKYTCTECNLVIDKLLDKKVTDDSEHREPTYELIKPFTCTESGFGYVACTACGYKAEKPAIIDAQHVWAKDLVVVKAPTCKEAGYGKKVCTVCGQEDTANGKVVYYPIDATGKHTYTEYVLKSGVCSEKDFVIFECSVCKDPADAKTLEKAKYTYLNNTDGVTFKYLDKETNTIKSKTIKNVVDYTKYNGKCDFSNPVKVEATCTEGAGTAKTCKVCGLKVMVTTTSAPLKHDEVKTTVPATCYVDGKITVTCYRCGIVLESKCETIPATNHSMKAVENDVRNVAATCSSKGIAVYACELCGYEELEATDYNKANHEYEVLKVYTAADCKTGTTGLVYEQCVKCHVNGVHTVPAAHTFVDTSVKKAPTCDVAGIMVQTCSVCEKATREVGIPKVAHVMITKEQAADCLNDAGIVTRCANCDLVTKFQKTGAQAYGHKWGEKLYVAPTCDTRGGYQFECLREGCGVVEFVELKDKDNAPLNHKGKTLVKEIEATCKAPAYAIYNCPICKTEITEIAGPVDAKNGHAWEVTSYYNYEPTCAKPGFVDRKCSLCGVTKTRVWHTPKHEMSDYVFTTDYVYRFCLGCGLIETIYVSENFTGFNGCSKITVDDKGNKTMTGAHMGLVVKPGKEGTCEEAGQIEHIECTVCGTIIQQGAVIPAHNVTVIEAKAATCTEEGNTAGKYCETCKEYIVKPETIAKVAHTVVEVPAVDATATTAGTTAGKKCSVCGEILEGCEPVAKLGATVKRLCVVRSKAADYREDATSEVVKMLAEGTAVVITGELVNEYYPVEGGYIHMSYITVA